MKIRKKIENILDKYDDMWDEDQVKQAKFWLDSQTKQDEGDSK